MTGARGPAVLYDFVAVAGGAERVFYDMLETLPGATGYAALVDPEVPRRFGVQADVRAGGEGVSRGVRLVLATMWYFLRLRFSGVLRRHPAAVFSGLYSVIAAGACRGRRVYYCHTPPRMVTDLYEHYWGSARLTGKAYLLAMRWVYLPFYRWQLRRMDVVLVNSRNVADRLVRHLGITPDRVLFPPVRVAGIAVGPVGDYFLSTARLETHKRVDDIIRAFVALPGEQLVVASGGIDEPRLRALAGNAANIRFTGWLDDAALQQLVAGCRAVLYVPLDEDFGMSPVEAMAAGKPVIGVDSGGLRETVVHGETGLLVPEPLAPADIAQAVRELDRARCAAMQAACVARAQRFSREAFAGQLRALLD